MFDRGFGNATQPIEGTMTYGVSDQLAELFKEKRQRHAWQRHCASCAASTEW